MAASTRFSVAVHILTLLAQADGVPLTSGLIAGSVGTNEVVVRRLLGPLRREGFVESRSGTGGGWVLARDPGSVTLDQIWAAVEPEDGLVHRHGAPNPACLVGRNIQEALDAVALDGRRAWELALGQWTLAAMVTGVLGAEARRG